MFFDELEYIGVDETGVGDYFSPIVSVACFIPKENLELVKNLGIKDSKKITDSKIIQIAEHIIKNNLVHFKDTTLSQKGYNNLIKIGINNNSVKTLIHFNSIKRLLKKVGANKTIVIDQYASIENMKKHIKALKERSIVKDLNIDDFNLILETKAEEKFLSVACASVLARYLLLNKMKLQKDNYQGFKFKLGASNPIIDLGVDFVKKFGVDELENVAKVSFKTTNKILEKLNL
ncbi:ribonuclease HIII [Mycoplasmopsis arginini]|uniref:ribonuclease HIII n=1 Tax=Mycoplasmopsis arginini TaxID=2094 RepID=UPI0027346402|nr:ribonuclease HIII [Mycoplasmopsis arginini]MDP4042726.1 ribonuclease HIII [Mycoplasmopsis arginini]